MLKGMFDFIAKILSYVMALTFIAVGVTGFLLFEVNTYAPQRFGGESANLVGAPAVFYSAIMIIAGLLCFFEASERFSRIRKILWYVLIFSMAGWIIYGLYEKA